MSMPMSMSMMGLVFDREFADRDSSCPREKRCRGSTKKEREREKARIVSITFGSDCCSCCSCCVLSRRNIAFNFQWVNLNDRSHLFVFVWTSWPSDVQAHKLERRWLASAGHQSGRSTSSRRRAALECSSFRAPVSLPVLFIRVVALTPIMTMRANRSGIIPD